MTVVGKLFGIVQAAPAPLLLPAAEPLALDSSALYSFASRQAPLLSSYARKSVKQGDLCLICAFGHSFPFKLLSSSCLKSVIVDEN